MQSIKIRLKTIAIALCTGTLFLTGCSNLLPNKQGPKESSPPLFSFPFLFGSPSLDDYKKTVAQHIISDNPTKTYSSRPQALLRAVIVLKFRIDANGRLLHSEVMRSNRDRAAEVTALASLKNAAPFPNPNTRLLLRGQVEVIESWLFNDDGRFQLRSTADAQMNEVAAVTALASHALLTYHQATADMIQ